MKTRKVFPVAILDQDSDVRNVAPNHVRFALNCLLNDTNGESTGTIENRKGNLLVSTTLPIGRNKVIGTCADIDKNAILYMVFNDQNMHCIMRYNELSNSIDRIVYSNPYLNFQEDHLITHMNIIGDLLYWTDGYFSKFTWDPQEGEFPDIGFNGPRKINMVKAYNLTNNINVPAAQKYTQINERVLDRIKYPPYKQPEVVYNDDNEKKYNYLVGSLFQFSYAYVYDDNEVSVLSPISDVPIPVSQENSDGSFTELMPVHNNCIHIKFDTGPEIVKQIKLFVRRLNDGDWYLFDTIEKYNSDGLLLIQNDIIYGDTLNPNYPQKLFYNNEVLVPQLQADLARTQDFIGQVVDSLALINNGRMIDAGIIENYNNIDIDVNIDHDYFDVSFNDAIGNFLSVGVYYHINQLDGLYFDFPAIGYGVGVVGEIYELTWSTYDTTTLQIIQTFSFSTTFLSTDTYPLSMVERFKLMIEAEITNAQVYWSVNFGIYHMVIYLSNMPQDGITVINNHGYIIGFTPVVKSFKEGFDHLFGIQYFDRAGRHGAVNKSDESESYVKFITETAYAGIDSGIKKASFFNWEINHIPPEWATQYQWFYARQTQKFVQYYYTEAAVDGYGNIRIKINDKFVMLVDQRKNSKLEAYTFTDGDRVRFIAKGKYSTPNSWRYFSKFMDTEILGLDIATGEIIIRDIGFTDNGIDLYTSAFDYGIFEIYSPRKITDKSFYFAIGDRMDILNPNTSLRAHSGMNGQDQSYSTVITNIPILRIDIGSSNLPLFYFAFTIAYPYSGTVTSNYFVQGQSITISGLTDPLSQFLNGTHILDQDPTIDTVQGTMTISVTTTQNYPLLPNQYYNNYPPATGGTIDVVINPTGAKGVFLNGDVYVKGRYAVEPPLIPVESDRLSDYYPSNAISIGHVSAVVPDIKRQKYSTIRHSGQYLEDTRINNLSKVEVLDKDNVSNEHGDITAIRELGMTLKVLQPAKVTSFGIGYQSLSTADGGDIPVLSSTKILSNRRPSNLNFGCSNPESVLVSERYMYFYDINSGKFIRDDANGMDAISDRGVKTWFRKKKEQLLQAGKYYVLTTRKEAEIIVTFISYFTPPESREPVVSVDTIVYNENINFWTTFLSYYKTVGSEIHPPDYYGNLGNTMLSFMDGQLYVEGANPLYNNFFGDQYAMELDVIDNADFEKMKIYQALALSTNSNVGDFWDAPEVRTPESAKLPLGGLTVIRPGRFREKEGALYADVPRNMLTPMRGTDNFKMLNGDMMRGEVCVYKLRNTSTDSVQLYSVIFRNIPSEISK